MISKGYGWDSTICYCPKSWPVNFMLGNKREKSAIIASCLSGVSVSFPKAKLIPEKHYGPVIG